MIRGAASPQSQASLGICSNCHVLSSNYVPGTTAEPLPALFCIFPTITLQRSNYSHFNEKKNLKFREVEANSVDFLFNINGNLGNFTFEKWQRK